MPRIHPGQLAGHADHVLNRDNGGAVVFHKDTDCVAFLALLQTAKSKFPVHVLGFYRMPGSDFCLHTFDLCVCSRYSDMYERGTAHQY